MGKMPSSLLLRSVDPQGLVSVGHPSSISSCCYCTVRERPILIESGSSPYKRHTRLFQFDQDTHKWIGYILTLSKLPDEWLTFKDIDVVIDPAQFPSGVSPKPARLLELDGHIFIAVSLDDRHLGGTHKSASATKELVLGPWTFEEISVAWPSMKYNKNPPKADYEARQKLLEQRYFQSGELPRYLLNDDAAARREKVMTPEYARRDVDLLFRALVSGRIDDRKKLLTLFFTLYPGVNDTGKYDPDWKYSTVEFVSNGALRAAGQTIFEKIHSDVVWRTASDASSVGLAFEAVALMFLHMGTQGMEAIVIQTHCRELLKKSAPREAQLELGFCSYQQSMGSSGQFKPIVDASDESEFFANVKQAGDTLKIDSTTSPGCVMLSSQSAVSFPPPGLANVDGMSGPRLGFQVTLQATHPPSGASYLKQRRELEVAANEDSIILFVVPYGRFKEGWTNYQHFKWKENKADGEEKDLPSNKRRRGASSEAKVAAPNDTIIPQSERSSAGKTLRQFVLSFTLSEMKTETDIAAPREESFASTNCVSPN